LDDCKPVVQRGDACVITPLVNEPSFPLFLFLDGNGAPVGEGQVTFKRTGGAALLARTGEDPIAVDSVIAVINGEGFSNPFPIEILAGGLVFAGSNDAVLGDLIVDLPSGRVIRRNYAVMPTVFYGLRTITTERIIK